MKHFAALILVAGLLSTPATADDAQNEERGLSLMERGAQMFMEGIMNEMEPAMKDLSDFADQMRPALRSFAREMGPKLGDLLDKVDDWNAYSAPEILPNGDIIIRRKPDHPMTPPDSPTAPEPQVDL